VAFHKKLCRTLDELQTDLNAWLTWYNAERIHAGRYCYGKTSLQTFGQIAGEGKASRTTLLNTGSSVL
jgi:hypothetical protein